MRCRHNNLFWACKISLSYVTVCNSQSLCVFVYFRPPATTGGAVVDDRSAFAFFNQSLASLPPEWTRFCVFIIFKFDSFFSIEFRSNQLIGLIFCLDWLIFSSSPILLFSSLESFVSFVFLTKIDSSDRLSSSVFFIFLSSRLLASAFPPSVSSAGDFLSFHYLRVCVPFTVSGSSLCLSTRPIVSRTVFTLTLKLFFNPASHISHFPFFRRALSQSLCVFVYIRPPATTDGAVLDDEGAFALFDQSLAIFWFEWTPFFCFVFFEFNSFFSIILIDWIDSSSQLIHFFRFRLFRPPRLFNRSSFRRFDRNRPV